MVKPLRCCALLLANPGLSADRLASLLGVSRRTVFRYLNQIRDSGFAVEFDPDLGGYVGSADEALKATNDEDGRR